MARTIALFGGSFNPPHVAHQMVCLLVLETCDVDTLWMVPTYRHPFHKQLVSFEHRHRMCQLAARVFCGRVEVSDIEAELGRPRSRTLDTLHALTARHPDARFRLIVGTDILGEIDKWYRWDEVVALAPPIVVERAGHPLPADRGDHVDLDILEGPALPQVSSTEVRARLSRGHSAVPLVPRLVMDYIAERGLYR